MKDDENYKNDIKKELKNSLGLLIDNNFKMIKKL